MARRALLPGPIRGAPVAVGFLRRQVADVREALLDEALREPEELREVVRRKEWLEVMPCGLGPADGGDGVVRSSMDRGRLRMRAPWLEPQDMVGPTGHQPSHVRLDGLHVLDVLLGRVRVVHAEVASTVVLAGDAEVEADGLGVADVEVAIRFRRESRDDEAMPSRGCVLRDDVADEVRGNGGRGRHVGHNRVRGPHHGTPRPSLPARTRGDVRRGDRGNGVSPLAGRCISPRSSGPRCACWQALLRRVTAAPRPRWPRPPCSGPVGRGRRSCRPRRRGAAPLRSGRRRRPPCAGGRARP
jgi:hypothetical protein